MRRSLYPRSLVELAYEQLLSMLVTMRIAPGAHIGIESLARQLKISQTPIREALTLLEAQKLAYKIPNVGFRAANLLTPEEIERLFEIRLLLEPQAAAFAAERGEEKLLRDAATLADSMGRMADENEIGYAQFAEGDAKLHQIVADATGNRFIAETIEGLHVHLHIFRFLFKTNSARRALEEHALLIDALLSRDAAGAERAMRAHLLGSKHRLVETIELQYASGVQEAATDKRPTREPKSPANHAASGEIIK